MAESRFGSAVRERTKLLAALLRTPNDGLLSFAQANELSERLSVQELERARALLDALGEGLRAEPDDPFWRRLEAALAILVGEAAPAPEAPPPVPPPLLVPPPRAPTTLAEKRPEGWRPHDPRVRRPEPDQEETAVLETGKEGTLKILAATTAATWPLKRVVRLEAAYASYCERGEPRIADICQFFDLPHEKAVRVALGAWRRRFEEDEELAAERDRLLGPRKRDDED